VLLVFCSNEVLYVYVLEILNLYC